MVAALCFIERSRAARITRAASASGSFRSQSIVWFCAAITRASTLAVVWVTALCSTRSTIPNVRSTVSFDGGTIEAMRFTVSLTSPCSTPPERYSAVKRSQTGRSSCTERCSTESGTFARRRSTQALDSVRWPVLPLSGTPLTAAARHSAPVLSSSNSLPSHHTANRPSKRAKASRMEYMLLVVSDLLMA